MVSSTLCPAVHILGSQNVYGRAEGITDHYWPWADFFLYWNSLPEGRTGENSPFCSIGHRPLRVRCPAWISVFQKRRSRASKGQQNPLPCCAHFRFPKCVRQGRGYRFFLSLCLCFFLFFCLRLSRNLLFERHLFLFSSNSKSMHVYMHACVHLCLHARVCFGG